MDENLLPLEEKRPLMRAWKWIGLAVFALGTLLHRWLPGAVVALACAYGIVVISHVLCYLLRGLKNRLFWSVRNRVLGSFVFVGLIPLLVIAGVVYLSLRMLLGQLASNFVELSLGEFEHELSLINVEMGQQISRGTSTSALDLIAASAFESHAARFPRLAARLAHKRQDGVFETVWIADPQGIVPKLERYPAGKWLGAGPFFEGLLGAKQTMLLTSLRSAPQLPDHYLDLCAPLDSNIEMRMEREKSIYATFISTEASKVEISNTGIKVTNQSDGEGKRARESEIAIEKQVQSSETRRKKDARRMISWMLVLDSKNLSSGEDAGGLVIVHVPLEVLYNHYLAGSSELGALLLKVIFILLGLFVFAELASLVIGGTISRRITRSVHDIYQGTLALQEGDLQHRVPVRRNDQLGMLAHSFNRTSASIQRLLEEVGEKKRLEQELEIAREVQSTLFPRSLPHLRGLAIFGGCEPARVVSGDYYDFVVEDEARLHIIVGDISGKGISAALLMANLQAAMRGLLMTIKQASPAGVERKMAEVMAQLNQQIYQNSPSEKYATLFLGRYDAENSRLVYCNAGHLPPILLVDDGLQRLEAGGVVLGLFSNMQYSSSSIELAPGTVLAVFTDGVTEAVNGADEEFGEERLVEALREARSCSPEAIYRNVFEQVRKWQGSLKQHDDITLIVAKVG